MEKQTGSVTKLTLLIMPSEVQGSTYYDAFNCAITQALKRAGRADLIDIGIGIRTLDTHRRFDSYNIKGYSKISKYVLSQYANKRKNKSGRNKLKEFTIEFDESVYSDACSEQVPLWLAKLRKIFRIKK